MIPVALAVVLRRGKVLVARRRQDAHLGGLWEFPGGKVRAGETALAAARREMEEETGMTGGRFRQLTCLRHTYPDRDLLLTAFVVTGAVGEAQPRASQEVQWMPPGEVDPAAMPAASRAILEKLRRRLG
ncbi:MAG: (deoxy)nucleoside triphosphate pyrophosphohydrolase [Acidobacteriota bacterium]